MRYVTDRHYVFNARSRIHYQAHVQRFPGCDVYANVVCLDHYSIIMGKSIFNY